MDKKSKASDDREDLLVCPICLEIPRNEIYQCKNGHILCDGCSKSLKICPQCRVGYGGQKIRNRAMEALLDSMEFECVNKSKGCQLKVSRLLLTNHENICEFKPLKLCKLIGYDKCEFVVPAKMCQLTIAHLKSVHGIPVGEGTELSIVHENFMSAKMIQKGGKCNSLKWEPLLWRLEKDNFSPHFLLLFRMSQSQIHMCSWTCLHIGESGEEATKFKVEYSFPNVFGHGQHFELKWTNVPSPFREIQKSLQETSFPTPFSFFKEYMRQPGTSEENQNDSLTLRGKITSNSIKGKKKTVEAENAIHLVQLM